MPAYYEQDINSCIINQSGKENINYSYCVLLKIVLSNNTWSYKKWVHQLFRKMTKNVFTFFIRECLITRHNLFLIGLCASYYRTHVPFSAYVTKRSVRIWWILIRHFFLFREYRKQDWTLYWKMLFWFFYWSLLSYNVKETFIFFLIVIHF